MNHTTNTSQLEISSEFEKFKIGLAKRIINNYENTPERQRSLIKLRDITIVRAIKQNALCKEVLPILWDASPPQNEKDYCYNSQTVYVRIIGGYNKELKVRCYFHGSIKGNPIKGNFIQSEVDKITADNIIDVVKEAASREVFEESNIKLEFIDVNGCLLNIYDNNIIGNYSIVIGNENNRHTLTINLSSNNYELLKNCFNDNYEIHKAFMENTGEISGIIL